MENREYNWAAEFTVAEMVSFGNYLGSKDRIQNKSETAVSLNNRVDASYLLEDSVFFVSHADFCNWHDTIRQHAAQ